MHSDVKKRRASFLVALLFAAGDLQRWAEIGEDLGNHHGTYREF